MIYTSRGRTSPFCAIVTSEKETNRTRASFLERKERVTKRGRRIERSRVAGFDEEGHLV